MSDRVLCLRPEADFTRVDAAAAGQPRGRLSRAGRCARCRPDRRPRDALVIPAVGPKLAPALFEGTALKLVQVTGAGVDRLDQAALTRLGIPVANVPGGSNSAVAEYAVTTASVLLRRFAWADAEIKAGNYAKFRARMVADNLAGLEGLLVGLVGFGTIGRRGGAGVPCARARRSASSIRRRAIRRPRRCAAQRDVARRAAGDRRRGDAACAAAAGDRRT